MIPRNKHATHEGHLKRCLNLDYGSHVGTIIPADGSEGMSHHSKVELWHCDDCNLDYLVDWYREGV